MNSFSEELIDYMNKLIPNDLIKTKLGIHFESYDYSSAKVELVTSTSSWRHRDKFRYGHGRFRKFVAPFEIEYMNVMI